MMSGDLLTNIDFISLLKYHNEQSSVAITCLSEYDFQIPYGVVKLSKQKVVSTTEKPMNFFFINAGIYDLNQSLLMQVDGESYIDMPNLLEKKISENERVSIFPMHEYCLDIGQIDQLEKAKLDSKRLFE